MIDEELENAISSCLQCGYGISKRNLNLLSTTIHKAVESEPEILVNILKQQLCDFSSPLAPTRTLLAISQDLERMDSSFYDPITTRVINMDSATQNSSIINSIHNAVFILPVDSLNPDKANEMANKIIELLHQTMKTENYSQVLATALSQFMKKWANILPNPENQTMLILSILSEPTLNYTNISLLCQAAIYCICALIGDMSGLKDMIGTLVEHKETPLDKCTSVSGITFMEYIQQTIPQCVQFQLLASFLFTIPPDYYALISPNAYLIYECISISPTDEISQTAFFQMLSAALKVMAKSNQPEFLLRCKDAILSLTDTKDQYLRKSIRQCFTALVQCALKVCNQTFFIDVFQRIEKLPDKSSLKQDCLSLVIPFIPFDLITIDFFSSILDLVEIHQSFAFRCVSEIYRSHKVPLKYSNLFFQKLDTLPSPLKNNFILTILRNSPKVVLTLQSHVSLSPVLDDSQKLSMQIYLAPVLLSQQAQGNGKQIPFDRNLIKVAIHSWDFEIRLNALKLLISGPRGNKPYSKEDILLLSEAIPRVFVYCDVKYQKILEKHFQMVCNHMNMHDNFCMSQFFSPLFKSMVPLLKPHLSGFRKSYIINTFNIVWHSRPLLFLTRELLENLVYNLFESNYNVRDLIFRFLLLILRTKEPADKALLAKQVISKDSKLVSDLIQKHSSSTKFRETDGAARLIALIYLGRGNKDIEEIISKMWQEIWENSKEPQAITPHFPLSVILHVLQSVQELQIDFNFITSKLMVKSIQIIHDSLDFIGVEANIETMPVQSIKGGETPVSQLIDNINRAWLSVRQALNIIGYILNRYFTRLPLDLIEKAGTTILGFLMDSRHASTVYHAHLIFQTICTLSFTREDTKDLPSKWSDTLLSQADMFTITDHKQSNGFVLTALALIHSEPSHLFAQQRQIYDKLARFCSRYIVDGANGNQLVTGFLLTQSIATDNLTQSNFEPYSSSLLMACFQACSMTLPFSLKNTCNICLCTLLLRHWKGKSDFSKDYEAIPHLDFFSLVNGSLDFFIEHLVAEQPDVSYIILLVIQQLKPFPMDMLLLKITEMRSSPSSRSRRAAARALLVVLSQEDAIQFIKTALNDIETCDSNTLDGILMQITELVHHYPSLIKELLEDAKQIIQKALDRHETSYIKLYFYIQLADLFSLTNMMKPVLRALFKDPLSLIRRPYGSRILIVVFKTMTDIELLQVILKKQDFMLYHICRFLDENPIYLKPKIARALIDAFLKDPSPAVYDKILKLLIHHPKLFNPNDFQKQLFNELLAKSEKDEAKLMSLLSVASMFIVDIISLLNNFQQYSYFVDRSDSTILENLSHIMEDYHEQLFTTFSSTQVTQWLLALRIISDENPSVRIPCCRALSKHIILDPLHKIVLSEYDLIVAIYGKMTPYKDLLQKVLSQLQANCEQIEDDKGIKREPTPFIHPPSFHVDCLRKAIKTK